MTEAEWLECADPTSMLEFLKAKASDRKLRLFAVACCRSIVHLFSGEQYFAKLVFAELMAERQDTRADRRRNAKLGHQGELTTAWSALSSACEPSPYWAAINASQHAAVAMSEVGSNLRWWRRQDKAAQASFVRDVFGTPFHPIAIDPSWLTPDVLSLATGIYQDRAFDRMPILADALQDAGCDNDDILSHCRQPGEHVRGCWVVDLLLGKK